MIVLQSKEPARALVRNTQFTSNGSLAQVMISQLTEGQTSLKLSKLPIIDHDFCRVKLGEEQTTQRASDCSLSPTRCPFGGACHSCPVQAKLTIGQPNDKYEQEADRIAVQVMSMPDPHVQRACSDCDEEATIQTKHLADQITPLVQRQPKVEDDEEGVMQPKRIDGYVQQAGLGLEAQIEALQGGGRPLPQSERNFFEPRFGNDFSQIRVHTNDKAAQSAQAIKACAYTVGQNIVFNANQFAPRSQEGRLLLAHELTHTLQQTDSKTPTTLRTVQRSYCPSHCARPASRGRTCRAPSRVRDVSERVAVDPRNRISHIRVLLSSRRVHLFYNGQPRTATGRFVDAGPCNPNRSETPRDWDVVGLKGNEDYTNLNKYNMAWFTAFRSTGRRIGFHNSQPLTGGPSAGCVRVSCELAWRINRDSASRWTSIKVR